MNNIYLLLATIFSSPIMTVLFAMLVFLIFGFLILVFIVIRMSVQLRHITYPVYDRVIKEVQNKANGIMDDADIQSRTIRIAAQEAEEKLLPNRREENEKFQKEYTKYFEEIIAHGKDALAEQSSVLIRLSENMAEDFKKYALVAETLAHKESDIITATAAEESKRIKQSFTAMDTRAAEEHRAFVEETKKRLSDEITKEIATVKNTFAAYRQDRFNIIDQEIVNIIEKTAQIALSKTFSFKEHREQILIALEQAKKEGVFDK